MSIEKLMSVAAKFEKNLKKEAGMDEMVALLNKYSLYHRISKRFGSGAISIDWVLDPDAPNTEDEGFESVKVMSDAISEFANAFEQIENNYI